MKAERNRNFVHPPTLVAVIQRKETSAENGFKSPAKGYFRRIFLSGLNNAATSKVHTILAESASKNCGPNTCKGKGSDLVEQQRPQLRRDARGVMSTGVVVAYWNMEETDLL
jgi:hypothetical protein